MADGTYQVLRDAIRDKLLTLTDIQEVHRFPKLTFDGYPASTVIPLDSESDWETNTEDERVYSFDIQVFYGTKNIGNDTALDRLYNVVDQIRDVFSQNKTLSGTSMPVGKTILTVNPEPTGWEELSDNELLMATVTLNIKISVDNN